MPNKPQFNLAMAFGIMAVLGFLSCIMAQRLQILNNHSKIEQLSLIIEKNRLSKQALASQFKSELKSIEVGSALEDHPLVYHLGEELPFESRSDPLGETSTCLVVFFGNNVPTVEGQHEIGIRYYVKNGVIIKIQPEVVVLDY